MRHERRLQTPYFRSLTRKMVLTVILVSFSPMILVIAVLLTQFQTSFKDKVQAHLRELVTKHKQNVDGFLHDKLSDIRYISRAFPVQSLRDDAFLQEKLAMLQSEYHGVFVDIGLVNEAGQQVAYAGPFKLGKANYSDAEWFNHAINSEYSISDVFLGLRGLPHFIVSVKKTEQDQVWILRSTIDFVAFNTLVESTRIGETGCAFIINRKGEFQTKPRITALPTAQTLEKLLSRENRGTDVIQIMQHVDGTGQSNLYVSTFLKNGDWLLVYQQNVRDAFSLVRRAQHMALIIFLLGGLGIITMAFLLSRKLVSRIARADLEKDMMNQQVIETGKLASIGELAAGIAHEINNPVAIMVEEAGWIQDLLEEDVSNPENLTEFRRAVEQIQTQGKRCKEITLKLLSFARKTDSRIQTVDVNELLEEIIGLTAQRARYANILIEADLEAGLPPIRVSHTELQQIGLNLINNAVDAMEKAGGEIRIRTRRTSHHILMEIEDNGPGIAPANLNRIFDPFFTTKPVGKGTGLGLSICYGIIKKMGGNIEVKSVLDLGTSFQVFLPLADSGTETTQAPGMPHDR